MPIKRLSPLQAIHQRCRCCAETIRHIRECPFVNCELYKCRMGKREGTSSPERRRAIREYCLWCSGDQAIEVKACPVTECPLHRYRGSGIVPKRKEG